MRCYEDAVQQLTGREVPTLDGEDWALKLYEFLRPLGLRPRFIQVDQPAIVSRRLPNGKVHAEAMHPTLITLLEKAA